MAVSFLFNLPPATEIYTLSLHDALPILLFEDSQSGAQGRRGAACASDSRGSGSRSEEHTSELQSLRHLVCRLLLEKKNRSALAGQWPPRRRRRSLILV